MEFVRNDRDQIVNFWAVLNQEFADKFGRKSSVDRGRPNDCYGGYKKEDEGCIQCVNRQFCIAKFIKQGGVVYA